MCYKRQEFTNTKPSSQKQVVISQPCHASAMLRIVLPAGFLLCFYGRALIKKNVCFGIKVFFSCKSIAGKYMLYIELQLCFYCYISQATAQRSEWKYCICH